jgi:hypothetical protein
MDTVGRFQIDRLEERIAPTLGLGGLLGGLGLGGLGAGIGADVSASADVHLNVLNLISLGIGADVDASADVGI